MECTGKAHHEHDPNRHAQEVMSDGYRYTRRLDSAGRVPFVFRGLKATAKT